MSRTLPRILFCALLMQSSLTFGAPVPSRSPRTLSKKVDSFLHKINTQVSSNTYTVKRLKGILSEVSKCKTARDCIRILLSARKTYGADAQSNEYKKVWGALLVAVTKHLGTFAQKTLISVLDELEQRISFWEEQQAKPVNYFFHKNPLRWFMGKRQGKEVKDNIKAVHEMQKKYLGYLGQLTTSLDAFNENANLKQHHAWIMSILRTVHAIVCPDSKDKNLLQEKTLNKNVTKVMMTILSAIPKHKKEVQKTIYATQPPNHFASRWILYTALSAGAIWAYRNRNGKLTEWKDKLVDGAHRFYENHLFGPWQDFKSMFGFGNEDHRTAQDRRDDEQNARQALLNRAEQFYRNYKINIMNEEINDEELRRFRRALQEGDTSHLDVIRINLRSRLFPTQENQNQDQRTLLDNLIGSIDGSLQNIINNLGNAVNGLSQGIDQDINRTLGGLAASVRDLRNNIDPDNKRNSGLGSSLIGLVRVGRTSNNTLRSLRDQLAILENSLLRFQTNDQVPGPSMSVPVVSNHLNAQVINTLFDEISLRSVIDEDLQRQLEAMIEVSALTVDVYQIQLNQILAGQRLNLILLTAIPTVAVGVGGYYGLKAVYHYFRPAYTFAPMKKALSEISRVLNWYEERPVNKMSTVDYGTLLYFVHKLKLDARHIAKESTRRRFLRDVKEIELPQFSERQKMHVVTRMYREYDFLAI